MTDLFFAILLLISFFSMSVYSFFYEKKDLIFLFVLTIVLLPLIKLNWVSCLISIIFLITPIIFIKKINYTQLMFFCMSSSILMAYFILNLFLTYETPLIFSVVILSVFLICVLAIMGILESDLKKYLIYSNAIQLTFVILDLGVAKLSQNISTLGVIQIFNYTLAGLLFFITLGILSEDNKKKNISNLYGSYYRDKWNSIFAIIAALSLAGLPGLNIFVSEWFLFEAAFVINPIITILVIFAALLLFVMYFKIANIVLIGADEPFKRSISRLTYVNAILAILCLVFGLLPQLQLYILGKVL